MAEVRQGLLHDGRTIGYARAVGWFGHAVGSNEALKALIGTASAYLGPSFLLLTRNTRLFHWWLDERLCVGQVMMLMRLGLDNEPAGAYIPSVLSWQEGALPPSNYRLWLARHHAARWGKTTRPRPPWRVGSARRPPRGGCQWSSGRRPGRGGL